MSTPDVADTLQRMRAELERRPEFGLSDDAPATARWLGGVATVATHANGTQVPTDMPTELGGSGQRVTPGWLFRAGVASCLATSIAMQAASEGIALDRLEVQVRSRSDTRGLLGLSEADGEAVSAAPRDLQLRVQISAAGVAPDRLRALVESSRRCSPIPSAVGLPLALHVEVGA